MIKIAKMHEDAIIPTRGSAEAAGLELYIVESAVIVPGNRALLKTGISMAIPSGYAGLIWPRSKLAAKYGIDVLAGVVDSDYRGEIMVSLLNTGRNTVELKKGEKVAQMIIQEVFDYHLTIVDRLDETQRGVAGVNSTEMRLK